MRERMVDGIYESQAFALQGINVHELEHKLKVAEQRSHNVRHMNRSASWHNNITITPLQIQDISGPTIQFKAWGGM